VTTGGGRGDATRPAPLLVASGLVALQGLVGIAYGLYLGIRALVDDSAESLAGAEIGALLLIAGGAGILACARGLASRQGWARAPVITVQLLTALVGFNFVQAPGPFPFFGAVAILLAGAVLYSLATPAARLAFAEDD
jgi:hypothetical protein